MKPVTKKPLKSASARKPLTKDAAKAPKAPAPQKAAKAPKAAPAPVAPATPPAAAQAAPDAPRASLRALAQAVVETWRLPAGTSDAWERQQQALQDMERFLASAPKSERGPAKPTETQEKLIAACQREGGATAKELAAAAGWPAIAARATMTKLAERFGYALSEKAKTADRGITFFLSTKTE